MLEPTGRKAGDPSQGRVKNLTALRPVVAAMLLVLSVSACSASGHPAKNPGVAASEACGAALDSSAAAALRRMTEADRFYQIFDGDDGYGFLGRAGKPSPRREVGNLRDFTSGWECYLTKTDADGFPPGIDVSFTAQDFLIKENKPPERGEKYYPIGAYARTRKNSSAQIIFACPTRSVEKKGDTVPYVEGEFFVVPSQLSPKATERDPMVVLISFARAAATQLGCLSQAHIPAQVPRV
ncbi:hypothetical protein ABT298_18545 [Streptomyces sp. NPDC001034]|uniref:hypothetical protein n=1 Tax=Streptomyces sp. NPDC001034 TaxID=3154375 RepID=UPI00332C0F40